MGDDNEIRQLIRTESESFLKTALVQSKDVVKTYDLDVEFAKTKHNKSFVVLVATLIAIAAVGVVAFGVTRAIESSIAAAPVDVQSFEDLNLKDILDTSKRNEADIERAKLELTQLQQDFRTNLDAVNRDYQSTVESVKASSSGPADEKAKLAAAADATTAKKKKLQADFAAASSAKQAEIAAIQKKIDQYDSRTVEQAKKQQAVLDSERMAFDIEKKQQADSYEARIAALEAARKKDIADLNQQKEELAASLTARYNPTYADDLSASLLADVKSDLPPAAAPAPFHPYLSTAGVLDAKAMTQLDQSFSDFEFLSSKLRAVPYLNSVPAALSRMETEARSSLAAYRAALAAAGSGLKGKDKQIADLTARAEAAEKSLEQFRWAVSSYARRSRESGYVIDARDKDRLAIYLDPTVPVSDGAIGYAVRGDRTIATLTFHVGGGKVGASVSHLEADETLLAFDSIVVDASKEAAQ